MTAIIVRMARGRVGRGDDSRQGAMPVRLLGDKVRVMAYERRR